jgi:hypothetical protein
LRDDHPGGRAFFWGRCRSDQRIHEVIFGSSEEERKLLWQEGLATLDKVTERKQGVKCKDCTAEQQRRLLKRISEHEDYPTSLEERFFVAVKRSTVEGYYSSEIGIHQELEYQGNAYLPSFHGCNNDAHSS